MESVIGMTSDIEFTEEQLDLIDLTVNSVIIQLGWTNLIKRV